MELFIDTNIYLTFYHYTNEDLEELKKLLVLIESGKIRLHITEQVINEFKRNRESKISDALEKFEKQELNNKFPQICKEYAEYDELRKSIKNYEENKNIIIKKLKDDIESNKLGADEIINSLFEKGNLLKIDEKILGKAKDRMSLGNPPGKNGSLGDSVNWEILLSEIPPENAICLISDDKDYFSPINEYKLSQYLNDEWIKLKNSNILFYRKLSDFFRDKFPEIKLASELEKEIAITNLVNSFNFQNTHKAILRLSQYNDFTNQQVNEIITAGIENSQINWISEDQDVRSFYSKILNDYEKYIDEEKIKKINEIYIESISSDTENDEDVF